MANRSRSILVTAWLATGLVTLLRASCAGSEPGGSTGSAAWC